MKSIWLVPVLVVLILGYISLNDAFAVTEDEKLTASDAAAGDLFGVSVAVSGDTMVVGAIGTDDAGRASGSAYVFTKSGTTWSEQANLTAKGAPSFLTRDDGTAAPAPAQRLIRCSAQATPPRPMLARGGPLAVLFNSYIFLFAFLPAMWLLYRLAASRGRRSIALGLLVGGSLVYYEQRGVHIKWEDPQLGRKVKGVGITPKFSATPGEIWRGSVALGYDNELVFDRLLGLSASDLAQLKEQGVI